MRKFRIIFLFFISMFFMGCKSDKNVRLISDLKKYPHLFNSVVRTCYADPKLNSRMNENVDFDDLSFETQESLELLELGEIYHVALSSSDCPLKASLKLEIYTAKNECLEYSPCKDNIHESGQHQYYSGSEIDLYYLNENWVFWIDTDFL